MNPSSNETPNIQLPQQSAEQPINVATNPNLNPAPLNSAEQARGAVEQAQVVPQMPAMPLPPLSVPPTQVQPTTAPTTDVSMTMPSSKSSIIEDSDLIEKEWVNKAKQIVERNRDDPYKQSEELTVVKADYMKTHYDKNIKLK